MAKKNRIFSGLDQQGKPKQKEEKFVSKYYSTTARKFRKRKRKIKSYLGGATSGTEAHDRFKAIMDNFNEGDRDEIRGLLSDDIFEAADDLIEDTTGYWTKDEFLEKVNSLTPDYTEEDIFGNNDEF